MKLKNQILSMCLCPFTVIAYKILDCTYIHVQVCKFLLIITFYQPLNWKIRIKKVPSVLHHTRDIRDTVISWHPWHHDTHDTVTSWHRRILTPETPLHHDTSDTHDTVTLWHHDIVTLWHRDTVASCRDTVTLWHRDTVILVIRPSYNYQLGFDT